MVDRPTIYLGGVQCGPGLDDKLNKWYNETHIPLLFKSEHVLSVTRYKLVPVLEEQSPTYLAVYDFKDREAVEAWFAGPDMAAAVADTKKTWAEGGFEAPWQGVYEPLMTWRK
jgi:hypothetical protein